MIMRSRPEMEIREILPPEMEAARRLLQSAGWAGRLPMAWKMAAREGVAGFYERIGFVRSQVAMERPRARKSGN